MNKLLLYIFSVGLAGLSACNSVLKNEEESLKFLSGDSVIFNTGFSFEDKPSGSFYNNKLEQECYYFGDLITSKVVKVFDKKGKEILAISLNEVLKKAESVNDVEVLSIDTILVLSQYTNRIFILNREGVIWKEIDLNPLIQKDSLWVSELNSSYYSDMLLNKSSLVLSMTHGLSSKGFNEFSDAKFTVEYWKRPQFVVFKDIFSDSIKTNEGFEMYQQIAPADSFYECIEVKSFLLNGNEVFAHSVYSDSIFILNAATLRYKAAKIIRTTLTEVGAERVNVSNKTPDELYELLKSSWNSGRISRHYFNKKLKHHYVIISKKVEEEFYEEEGFVPWVMLIYDNKFQKIKELTFNDDFYYPFLLPTKKGFLLQRRKVAFKKYSDQKLIFDEFIFKTLLTFAIFSMLSCESEKEKQKKQLKEYIESYGFDYENLRSILVLTEEGCPTCNKSFSDFIKIHLENPKNLCIISAKGNHVDVSDFISSKNVIMDFDQAFKKTKVSYGTCSILINENHLIDTVIQIRPIDINLSLDYLRERL